MAINLLRELIWAKEENELSKDKIIRCIEEIKKNSNIGEKYGKISFRNLIKSEIGFFFKIITCGVRKYLRICFKNFVFLLDLDRMFLSNFSQTSL